MGRVYGNHVSSQEAIHPTRQTFPCALLRDGTIAAKKNADKCQGLETGGTFGYD